jgi:transcriptional regulator GlxA family with amidase domain
MYRVALLALQNCMYSSLAGPFDFFSVASNEWARTTGDTLQPLFQSTIVAPEDRAVTTFNGLAIAAGASLADETQYDIVYIPVIFPPLEPHLADTATIAWLSRQAEGGACLCSVCSGAFLLAATGRLDGRRATTHWMMADSFAARFPKVILKQEKILIDEGDCITAGGVSAYHDLSLYLASRFGSPDLAATLSRMLLIDPFRRLQSPYATRSFNKSHGDEQILLVQDWLEQNPSHSVNTGMLAERAGLGERTFMRRFKKATGDSPLEYLQHLRIQTARQLLESTRKTIEEITWQSGYEDISSFRKLFRRTTGLSPSAYRQRFS